MFKILSILLSYPDKNWLDQLDEIEQFTINHYPKKIMLLKPFFSYLRQYDEIELQEKYVTTFDNTRSCSLHLFEHIHGEDKERGQAMVDLLGEYQLHGFEPNNDLPDYLPLILEFLSQIDKKSANKILADAVHVINYLAGNLHKTQSIYANLIDIIVLSSSIKPEALKVAPVRNMDEALEIFGTTNEGVEPLMNSKITQTIEFYPQHKF